MKLKTRVQKIKKWLNMDDNSLCPFFKRGTYIAYISMQKHCAFCEGLFNYEKLGKCPCYMVTEEFVTEKAQQFVDSWDKLHKEGE